MEIDSEVLETVPDERLITALTSTRMDARSDFQLEGDGPTTIVNHSFLVSPKGWSRIAAPFSSAGIQDKLMVGLEQFKRYIESEAQRRAAQ
jgi:hypothetical protein